MTRLILIVFMSASFSWGTPDDAEIVKSFKVYMETHISSYKVDSRQRVALLGGGWVNEYYEPVTNSLTIDVRRTDSLVAPYKGIAEFTLVRHFTAFHSNREEAAKDTNFIKKDSMLHRHTYALSDGQWSVKSREHFIEYFKKWSDCNEILKMGPRKGDTDLFGCFERSDRLTGILRLPADRRLYRNESCRT